MRYRRLVLLLAVWLGTTAYGLPNPYAPERFDLDLQPGWGRVLISTAAPGPCWGKSMQLEIRQLPDTTSIWGMAVPLDDAIMASDFEDRTGAIAISTLPAGNYEVYASFNGKLRTLDAPRYVFTLAEGENLYLGEYVETVGCAKVTAGAFRDQRERDQALLKARNPALADLVFITRIPTPLGRWPKDRKKLPERPDLNGPQSETPTPKARAVG